MLRKEGKYLKFLSFSFPPLKKGKIPLFPPLLKGDVKKRRENPPLSPFIKGGC
jgi:hypothetical protein